MTCNQENPPKSEIGQKLFLTGTRPWQPRLCSHVNIQYCTVHSRAMWHLQRTQLNSVCCESVILSKPFPPADGLRDGEIQSNGKIRELDVRELCPCSVVYCPQIASCSPCISYPVTWSTSPLACWRNEKRTEMKSKSWINPAANDVPAPLIYINRLSLEFISR